MSSREMVTQMMEDLKDMDTSKIMKVSQCENELFFRNKISTVEDMQEKAEEDVDMESEKRLEEGVQELHEDQKEGIKEVRDVNLNEAVNEEGNLGNNAMEQTVLDECEEEVFQSEVQEIVDEADNCNDSNDNPSDDKDSNEEMHEVDILAESVENAEEKQGDTIEDNTGDLIENDGDPLDNENPFDGDPLNSDVPVDANSLEAQRDSIVEGKDSEPEKSTKTSQESTEPVIRKSSRIRKPKSYNILNVAKSSSAKTILNVAKSSIVKSDSKSPKGRKRAASEVVELSDSDNGHTEKEEDKDNPDRDLGDRCKDPGADATRAIDSDLLEPFRYGWVREVCFRSNKTGPSTCDIYYWPPEKSRRKRRSKRDQEIYFDDFPSDTLSSLNFSYVRRPLGLNNEAYEVVRDAKISSTPRPEEKRERKAPRYTEVAEHEGLLSSSSDEEDLSDEELKGEFDVELPISLQMVLGVTQLREEHIKRRKHPDRAECLTPPLAADMPWTHLDDDPLGVFTEIGGRSCPATPPPLRAVRLTSHTTVNSIVQKLMEIRANLADPVQCSLEKDKDALEQKEHLSSHDTAIKKYKNYVEKKPVHQAVRGPQGLKRFQGISGVPGRPGSGPGRPIRPPCSPHCLGMAGRLPDLQCSGCQCWFHGRCQGVPVGVTKFRCRNCPVARSAVGVAGRVSSPARPIGQSSPAGFVKVRLPMPSTNGKRPVVELVMLTNGKYQPIKFTNNRQVTESIPKRLFDQATQNMKTLYQRSVQVPKIGTKQVFLAINPSPGGGRPFHGTGGVNSKPSTSSPRPPSDQVSILVKPASGGSAVLLNVPRTVALKVKVGTTLSFSASNNQKYTVLDNKMHAAVGRGAQQKSGGSVDRTQQRPGVGVARGSGGMARPQQSGSAARGNIPVLPRGVSIKPITALQRAQQRPFIPQQKRPVQGNNRLPEMDFSPCSPYCPGVTGIPELECSNCHSLFHPKCVGIPQARVSALAKSFKCKMCSGRTSAPKPNVQVINLD